MMIPKSLGCRTGNQDLFAPPLKNFPTSGPVFWEKNKNTTRDSEKGSNPRKENDVDSEFDPVV
jgi:hypothetical protein